MKLASGVAVVVAVGVGLAFLWLDPAGALRGPAALEAGRAGLTALAWGWAALGAGAALLRRRAPGLLDGPLGLLHAAVAGLLLWGLGALALAALGLLALPGLAALWALLALGWATRPGLRWPRPGILALGALVLFPGLLDALAPPIDTDELYYQLALPREMLRAHGLVGGLLRPDGNRPMILHLPYAALMATGGLSAPRLLHLALAGGLLGATVAMGRRWLGRGAGEAAALLMVGSWSFLQETGLAANNLPTALAVLAALDAGLAGSTLGLLLASGLALSLKYTAAGPLLGIFLVAALPWRARALAGLGALLVVSPWWLRNALMGLHPLFPFAGWPRIEDMNVRFQYLDKYGAGRDWRATLLLPWNAVMTAEIGDFRFLGRLNPALLALAPGALWAARAGLARKVALVAAIGALAWAAGPQWLRHLLPTLPVLALALGAAVGESGPFSGRAARAAMLAVGLVGLPANLGPLLSRVADRWPAATGQESSASFLSRDLESWPAVSWCNEHLPADARVALLFDWDNALMERATVLGSVEDHVPVRYLLLRDGDAFLERLAAAGVTHLVVGRVHFLHKVYPFLDDATFEAELQEPAERLDALLLRQATLIFQEGRVRVYRLDAIPRP